MLQEQDDVSSEESLSEIETKEEEEIEYVGSKLFSSPVLSPNSTIQTDIIEFIHSFSYDCKKYYNLCVLEPETIAFLSGNLLHFFNVATSIVQTRRSATGGGIGAIKKNPVLPHLVVAENGKCPPIFIYSFPEMEVVSVLKKGTTFTFSCLDFSPDGEMLVSQGGEPDYLLIIWNWRDASIILNVKSYYNDILNLKFSNSVSGQITTSGIGHIKFWKMAQTFTGLKLQGEVGRFGKTEISDIFGIYPMPDEKVLSGCEWGNILVWEHGLITLEVCRKGKRKCHSGPITQIFSRNGEIITIGTDGYIRVWFWETVDLADPPENNRFVEIEPIYEYRIGSANYSSELLAIENIEAQKYYLQDGNGGIWSCDIGTDSKAEPPKQLFWCHSGPILAIAASPISPHVATFGKDGRLFMYNYETKKLIFHHEFISQGDDMVWFPVSIDPSGVVIVLGFDDGVLRVITVDLSENYENSNPVQLIQVLKSHSEPIRKLSFNENETILVSGGDDNLIFIHQISKEQPFVVLKPIGLVKTPSPVTCINWKPDMFSTILVGCKDGEVIEADLPDQPRSYVEISYHLKHIQPQVIQFVSTKGKIRREILLNQIERRKLKKRQKKIKKLQKIKEENPGAEINEEIFLADSESDEELSPVYVPKIPSRVLWAQYTSDGTIWMSMSGYDAGYIYEYDFDTEGPLKCTPIPNAEDTEINSYLYFDSYLIFGMGDGCLRINRVKDDFTDLSDFWVLPMHDNYHGNVNCMCFSYDKRFLFTGGADGNIFSYKWNLSIPDFEPPKHSPLVKLENDVVDIEDICYLSLEEEKQKADHDRRLEIALARKNEVLKVISKCKTEYELLIKRNKDLPESQRISYDELELDPRITKSLQKRFDDEMDLLKAKKAFDIAKIQLGGKKEMEYFLEPLDSIPIEVVGINSDISVKSFRIHKLDEDYFSSKEELEKHVKRDLERKRIMEETEHLTEDSVNTSVEEKEEASEESQREQLESFLQGLTESDVELKLESKCRRLLKKYRARKDKEVNRKKEWNQLNALKPNPDVNHPDDDKDLHEAGNSIGDYKLKFDPNYDAPEHLRDTTLKKFGELLRVRKEVYEIRQSYNQKVFALRAEKIKLMEYIEHKKYSLKEIHKKLEPTKQKHCNIEITINDDLEFPEKTFQLETYLKPQKIIQTNKETHVIEDKSYDIINLQSEILQLHSAESKDLLAQSVWETELLQFNLEVLLQQQDRILEQIETSVKLFDENISSLHEERLRVEINAKFLEQYLITVNQELWVLKDFEQLEEKIVEKIEQNIFERNRIHTELVQERTNVETYKCHIQELEEAQSDVETKFIENCRENEFWKFFKRIFYKKYRPPRVPKLRDENEDAVYETETESSLSDLYMSSSDEDEEEEEMAHRKIKDIALSELDENQCPEECNEQLFKLAHDSRKQYHYLQGNINSFDLKIIESNEIIEKLSLTQSNLKKEFEKTKHDLLLFRRDKQQMLNNIETVTILKMDQMQYFKNAADLKNIEHTLLFSNANVTKLYARVGQLALETLEVKRKHRINVVHLSRMKADIKFLEQQTVDLKEEINSAMMKKFGQIVDLDELEESILRRFVYEMRTNKEDLKKEYGKRINEIKKILAKKEEELTRTIQESTEKLNILTVMQEEKNYLHQVIVQQQKAQQRHVGREHLDYKKDVLKLREISKHQQEQIEMLQKEIRGLSFKCKVEDTPKTRERPEFHGTTPPSSQPFHQKMFEDSVYANIIESRADSSKTSTPNMELFKEIFTVVKLFFVKNISETVDTSNVQAIICTLARYLTNIATSFTPNQADKILPDIIDNFQTFIPQNILSLIPKYEIAKFVEHIVESFHHDYDLESQDAIKEIVEISVADLPRKDPKYSQNLLTEIIKQLIVTLRVQDINDDDNLKQLAKEMKRNGFNPCALVLNEMVNEICSYAAENYLDNIEQDWVKQIIDRIIYYVQK